MDFYVSSIIIYVCAIIEVSTLVGATPASSSVVCISSDTPDSCKARGLQFRENLRVNGYCPGCDTSSVCATSNIEGNSTPGLWKVDCARNGINAKKQCKGEPMAGKCFCYDPKGNRIFGEEEWTSDMMTDSICECSRLVWELQQTRSDVTLHCNDKGDFEDVQCDQGVCWCAREFDGTAYTSVVPQEMMKALPCYDVGANGDKYLRTCDSIRMAEEKTKNMLKIHGTENIAFNPVNCNYDGSYAKVQVAKSANGKTCVSKGNIAVWDFVADENATCNCAYDRFVADETFNLQCDTNGDYQTHQLAGGQQFCVDSDGFSMPCSTII